MDNRNIEITTRLSAKDLEQVLFRQIRTKLIFNGIIAVIFIIFIVLGVTALVLSKKNNLPLTNIFPLFIPLVIFILFPLFLIWTAKKQAKRTAENAEETKFVFNEQGMESESASTSAKILWAGFYKIMESDTAFLLYTQKNVAVPIPKHSFKSNSQITEFRNLLNEKLGAKAKLKNNL